MRALLAIAFAAGLIAGALLYAGGKATAKSPVADGKELYNRYCLACHGSFGDGKGPAAPWLWPRPRDFTKGAYKWRSTESGKPPTRADLATAIRHGVPGTSMHAFGATLSDAEVRALVDLLESFAPRVFANRATGVRFPKPPAHTPALLEHGAQVYKNLGCVSCHGPRAEGNGAAAKTLRDPVGKPAPPYDLTRLPLRRPRANAQTRRDRGVEAIYRTLVTGLAGTPMPSYKGVPDKDLWAVSMYVDSIRYKGPASATRPIHRIAIELDKKNNLTGVGFWPGRGTAGEERVWGSGLVALQGRPPAKLAPAQRSLHANQCARCHNKQAREWRGSLHAGASSPGTLAQFIAANDGFVESCQKCHAPLAEQLPRIRPAHRGAKGGGYRANPAYDRQLQAEGITCASCHLRGWKRYGPKRVASSKLLALGNYPLAEVPIYERADFCLGCHQLPASNALHGKPLLDTYREWLEGPYMPRGVQCQHCHMPNREHTWKGIHDPDTFRQGIDLEAIAGRSKSGTVSVRVRVRNVGAGHYLPTTPTPAAFIDVELIDEKGKTIAGAKTTKRIGRHIEYRGKWIELEDTRIPPGQSLEIAAGWKSGRVPQATHAKITIRVWPDEYYERFYLAKLSGRQAPEARKMYTEALKRTRDSRYVALTRLVPIAAIKRP